MFNNDAENKQIILLLRNDSKCNIIFRMQGKKFYNLAVPAQGENFIVINKDYYELKSSICGTPYNRKKELEKSLILQLALPEKNQTHNL